MTHLNGKRIMKLSQGYELGYNDITVMKINVRHIAKLANIIIQEDEVEKFAYQLSQVLGHIEKLREVNTTNVDPTNQVTGLENVLREDESQECLSQDESLSQTKNKHNDFFVVKGILESE